MNTKQLSRIFARSMYAMVILVLVFSTTGSVYAQEPVPWLIAFPEYDAVEGWEWPEGATVYLTINNAPEGFIREGTAEVTTWGDPRTYVRFEFWEDYDLQVGDMVILTDEFGTSTTHEVQPLSITGVDRDTDTVTGTANNDTFLQVWVHEQSEPPVEPTIIDGAWQAELTDVFDITYGTGGRAWVITEGGNATAVDWYVPNPHFTVFPEWEFFDGLDWPDGATVSISVAGKPECSLERESWGGFFNGNFPEGCNIETGDMVTFDDGTTNRWHVVHNLYVTDVSTSENTVTGKADVGETVYVWPHDGWFEPLQTVVDGSGVWQVDLDDAGYTVREDSEGRSEIRDEMGNATASDWHVTHPRFTVFPEWEWFDGNDWPNAAMVNITVEGKPECETVKESWGYFFNGSFGEGCDLEIGDTVTFADGETIQIHIVQNLAITKVNLEDDTIKGIASAGAEVHVWPHATGQEQVVIANPQGKWDVDFTGIYDLMPGDGGRAEIRDEFGNATAVDWFIPQPRFTIYPDAQWFDGIDWPDGVTVTITVKNKPECTFTRESWGGFFNGGFPEGCVVTAGDRVTFTDGTITRKHTVRNLAIIMVDKDANTVAGIAATDTVIHTWVWNSDGSTLDGSNLDVTAVNGGWLADFGALGIDLEVGMGIQAEIRDENGNATSVDLPVPDPRIIASITEDWFYIVDFIPGSALSLSIYENQGGSPVWQGTRTADVNGFAWIDSEGWDLEPGNHLVVSDGNTTKDLVIEGFTFDVFDLTNGQLSGTAPEPFGRTVWVGVGFPEDGWSMDVATDEAGAWFADFGQPVPPDYWWVAAQIFDDDGDASELRPASQIVFLRPACGNAYTVQAGSLLELRYGSWIAIGEELANQNAEHLTVELLLNGETVTGAQQPVMPGSEFPCGSPPEDAYGVFYIAQVGPLSPGTYTATVTWSFDVAVTDGYDADGDGEPDWYGPGEVFTREFTLFVP